MPLHCCCIRCCRYCDMTHQQRAMLCVAAAKSAAASAAHGLSHLEQGSGVSSDSSGSSTNSSDDSDSDSDSDDGDGDAVSDRPPDTRVGDSVPDIGPLTREQAVSGLPDALVGGVPPQTVAVDTAAGAASVVGPGVAVAVTASATAAVDALPSPSSDTVGAEDASDTGERAAKRHRAAEAHEASLPPPPPQGLPPLLSVVMALDHVTTVTLLQRHVQRICSQEAPPGPQFALWMYALLARLSAPVHSDTAATLRQLLKHLCRCRRDVAVDDVVVVGGGGGGAGSAGSSGGGRDDHAAAAAAADGDAVPEQLKSVNLLLCILRHCFGQDDTL
jgi:hypothetical protein